MVKKILSLVHPLLKRIYTWYNSRLSAFSYKGTKILIFPGVFHPGLFYSTKYLLDFSLNDLKISNQKILELGAGTGLISIFLAKNGNEVFASDINPDSVENVKENAKRGSLNINTYLSNLFDDIPLQSFDSILINPPYYQKNPKNMAEKAWFCGENFEYFDKLFGQIGDYIYQKSTILVVLSEDCDIESIERIANKYEYTFRMADKRKVWGEVNMIFYLVKITEVSQVRNQTLP